MDQDVKRKIYDYLYASAYSLELPYQKSPDVIFEEQFDDIIDGIEAIVEENKEVNNESL